MKKDEKFYSAIDGLRCLCFLSVFLFHTQVNGFQMGWAGVSVFFTISGFLITEILINAKESNNFFLFFYIRRSFRIFPIYFGLLFLLSIIFILKYLRYPSDFFYYLTYTQNFLWIKRSLSGDLQYFMGHTWSLAIEEQFYLIWPFVIYYTSKKHYATVNFLLVLVAILYRALTVIYGDNIYLTSVLLPSQIDLLALGGLLACVKNNLASNWINIVIKYSFLIGTLGLICVIVFVGWINVGIVHSYSLMENAKNYLNNPFTSQIFLFIGLIAIGLIKICVEQNNFFTRILNLEILRHFGKLSYGLYLYHWPVLIFVHRFTNNIFIVSTVGLLVTYVIAYFSFYYFEMYFIKLKNKYTY